MAGLFAIGDGAGVTRGLCAGVAWGWWSLRPWPDGWPALLADPLRPRVPRPFARSVAGLV